LYCGHLKRISSVAYLCLDSSQSPLKRDIDCFSIDDRFVLHQRRRLVRRPVVFQRLTGGFSIVSGVAVEFIRSKSANMALSTARSMSSRNGGLGEVRLLNHFSMNPVSNLALRNSESPKTSIKKPRFVLIPSTRYSRSARCIRSIASLR